MFSTRVTEGIQGDHRYYTGAIRWGMLEKMLIFPEQLGDLDDDHRMQRGLAKRRLGDLVEYLTEVDGHFFSAITLVMIPRDLDLPAVEDDGDVDDWDFRFVQDPGRFAAGQKPGTLEIGDNIRLFPADGQHRAAAALKALAEGHTGISKEQVPVVLVPYRDHNQVRQMFSDLNLNAKPVSKTTGYDFETRDPVALIAKSVAESVDLFRGRVNRHSNSLGASSAQVITLNTLVQGCHSLIRGLALNTCPEKAIDGSPKEVREARDEAVQRYLSDNDGDAAATEVAIAWQQIIDAFAPYWESVLAGDEGAAGKLRQEYVFPHGLGWLGLGEAAAQLIAQYGDEWSERFDAAVSSFSWKRDAEPWVGRATIYNEDTDSYRVNNTRPAVDDLARTVVSRAQSE
jgi:DNA sulfur modification protein DndB